MDALPGGRAALIHHPAFQSLVLPGLLAALALLGIGALARGSGARHAAWGGLFGLLGALAWWPGFDWPAPTRNQKLPWVVLAGLGLAALDTGRGAGTARPARVWLAALAIWAAGGAWLAGTAAFASVSVTGLVSGPVSGLVLTRTLLLGLALGGAVLFLLAGRRSDAPIQGAVSAAVVTLASLGLAGLAGTGGSLLLAQLALMLASSVVVTGGWAWLRRASGAVVSPALWLAFGLAWLAIAWSWVLAAPTPVAAAAGAVRVAGLAAIFALPVLLGVMQPSSRHALRWRWAGMLLAIGLAVLALAWPGGIDTAPAADTAADPDDPYLTPSWR